MELSKRMKEFYENRSKTCLTKRTPVIIRIDGKAFHTFTRGLKKPYDDLFHYVMGKTTEYLCKNIQGCKIGYTQSDEITLLLTDYDNIETDAWFDYSVQKLCSVSASMATMAFNMFLRYEYEDLEAYVDNKYGVVTDGIISDEDIKYKNKVREKLGLAMFDARCFNIPKEEVSNCFIWRQQDAIRNAIQSFGQAYFSEKELHKKNCKDIKEMLLEKGIDFEKQDTDIKRGVCCAKDEDGKWFIDYDIPDFIEDRDYIEKWV